MLNIAELEIRLKDAGEGVYSALERAAHTKIGEVLTETAEQLAAVLPEGAEVESLINTLVSFASVAHGLAHSAAASPDPDAPVPAAAIRPAATAADPAPA